MRRASRIGFLMWALVIGGVMIGPVAQSSHVEVTIKSDVGLFYDQLTEYGLWHRDPKYGLIWTPSGTAPHWHPYTMGHWSYTTLGWSWISDWSWGWATMHYGRWFYHTDYGWSWIPGIQWAPAWVAWRIGDGVVGWAPLPPEANWKAGQGLSESSKAIEQLPEQAWTYVRTPDLLKEKLLPSIISSSRNVTLLTQTRDITRYSATDGQVINHGPDVKHIEKLIGQALAPLQFVDVTFPKGEQATRVKENQLAIFRPHLVLESEVPEPSTKTPPPELPRDKLTRLHTTQLQVLTNHQAAERADLDRLHKQLKEQPPKGATPQQIDAWIAQEVAALERHNQEEIRLLKHRQQTELSALKP